MESKTLCCSAVQHSMYRRQNEATSCLGNTVCQNDREALAARDVKTLVFKGVLWGLGLWLRKTEKQEVIKSKDVGVSEVRSGMPVSVLVWVRIYLAAGVCAAGLWVSAPSEFSVVPRSCPECLHTCPGGCTSTEGLGVLIPSCSRVWCPHWYYKDSCASQGGCWQMGREKCVQNNFADCVIYSCPSVVLLAFLILPCAFIAHGTSSLTH